MATRVDHPRVTAGDGTARFFLWRAHVEKEVEHPSPAVTRPLQHRVRGMAARWGYGASELAEVLQLAADAPAAWSRAVALDERREAEFRRAGLLRVDA